MPCTKPLYACRTQAGGVRILKKDDPRKLEGFQLPCGQCMDCKLEKTRQWAVRITHEQQLHPSSWFVTLTYKYNQRSLDHTDFQLFMKRLRKHQKVSFFMCGEYGEKNEGAHYHAILFGLQLEDLVLHKTNKGNPLYKTAFLEKLWGKGHVLVGAVTFQSASYVASYCTKKITGKKAQEHYTRTDPETGEIYELRPEYAKMSLNPAIGKRWIQKYTDDVYNYDRVVINGRPQKTPRYYDKYLEQTQPARLEKHKAQRQIKAKEANKDNTPARLKVKAQVTQAKMKLKQRDL